MNKKRTKAFIKIKQSIQSSVHPTHLDICQQMIDNSTGIVTRDEFIILNEYIQTAYNLIRPFHFQDEMLNIHHSKLAAQ